MKYSTKSREELAEEVDALRGRIAELEADPGPGSNSLDRYLDPYRLWQETFNVLDDLIYIIDREFKIVRANRSTCENLATGELAGKKCFQLFHQLNNPANHCPACKVFHSGKPYHMERQEPLLDHRWFSISAYPIKDDHGFVWQCLVIYRDITDCKQMMDKLNESEIKDDLTGLINRRHFIDVLAREFRLAARRGSGLVFMIVTIDKFKDINESCGRKFGDYVLREISDLLVDNLRNTDICGRIGADEFGVLLPDADAAEGEMIARNIHSLLSRFVFDSGEIGRQVSISVGLAANNMNNLKNHEEFFSLADKAVNAAKKEGGNRVRVLNENDRQQEQLARLPGV
ncbi:MAG: sensor domain-containing diguanylate cyclase [Deltaproteobacteria bacterium]|nr:sensor domain-containing diguanylate cyclase [Deltaproteobacteria bacterium]